MNFSYTMKSDFFSHALVPFENEIQKYVINKVKKIISMAEKSYQSHILITFKQLTRRTK